ncbi:Sodium/calcium exchanger protein-domain-containing protein [Chytriomyces sp. MP71]|nr:Sodium/calcium exchanger protein-domain-containing protein [Chytriomyces sp. MP71]
MTVTSSLIAVWEANHFLNFVGLIFVPIGLLSGVLGWSATAVFALNFCAIIPLAKVLDYATDQLSMRVGDTVGGLLNASFGNAVELIMALTALNNGLFDVVKASVVGSILSNLLLVLGLCFLCGGLFPFQHNQHQTFDSDKASVSTGLLALTLVGYLVPSAMKWYLESVGGYNKDIESATVLNISRGISVLLLLTYAGYLLFHLYTNPDGLLRGHSDAEAGSSKTLAGNEEDEDQDEEPETLLWVALAALAASTLVIVLCADLLVGSIEGIAKEIRLSEAFVAIILLPIVGNAAEHLTAVSSAMRDKLDLSIQVAVGSAHQISLFVGPLVVLMGWWMDKGLDLDLGVFSLASLFVSVLVVNSVMADGKTHWYEGWLLLCGYLMISIGFWCQPAASAAGSAI